MKHIYSFKSICKERISQVSFVILSVFLLPYMAYGQEFTVSGKVTDVTSGEGLPGVTVLEKGTTNGTVTSFDGTFKLSVRENSTLTFSFVGFATEEIAINGRTAIDVVLSEDITQLSEVVVIGYGSVEKKDVTGAVASVSPEEFNKGIVPSADNLIAGKVAGVQITPGNGPGAGGSIRIRGASSISASSDPLFVVDGVIIVNDGYSGGRNALNFINPSDIADITILKDASATAIYGSRAANGVIIITTKSGQSGELKVAYDGNVAVSRFMRNVDILSPEEFRAAILFKAPNRASRMGEASTDWVDEITQTAISHQHNLTASGGSDDFNYRITLNHLDAKGAIKRSNNKVTRLSGKFHYSAFDDILKLEYSPLVAYTKDRFEMNVLGTALRFDPTQPVYDPENTLYGGYFQWADILAGNNPVATIEQTENTGKTWRIFNNFQAELKIPFVDGLSIKGVVGIDKKSGESYYYQPSSLKDASENEGSLSETKRTNTVSIYEAYLNYNKDLFSLNSHVEAVAGYSYQDVYTENSGYFMDQQERKNSFELNPNLRNRIESFFGRFSYDYDDRYIVTLNARYDGSTKFAPSNRFGFFPSAAFAWRIMEEGFAEGFLSRTFTDLKLRIGYGEIGNDKIGDYLYETYYYLGTEDAQYQFGDAYYRMMRPTGVDPDIKWEETRSTNIGLDFGILNGRLSGSLDVYKKFTNDMQFTIAVPAGSSLGDRILTNIGQMENKGVELMLNAVVIDRSNFDWNLSFNIAHNKNEIVKLDNSNLPDFPGYETGGISGDIGQTIQMLKVGESINTFRTYRQKYNENGLPVSGSMLEMYEDIDGDGIINERDLVLEHSPDPKFFGGLTSNMSYKNFDLALTFRGSIGNYVYNNNSSNGGYFDLLSGDGRNALYNINLSTFDTNFNQRQLKSDYYLENASFLKLDNISLGYRWDNFDKINLRTYITAQNVFYLTGYSGVDPEVFNGIDNNPYPVSTTVLLGINVGF